MTMTGDAAAVAAAERMFKGGIPTDQSGAEGGLASKAPGAQMNKAKQAPDEEPDEDEDEGEGEDTEDTEKSMVSTDDLMKSMDLLQQVAGGNTEPDRRVELAQKASDNTLTKSERAEFVALLGGTTDEDEVLERSYIQNFSENEELKKGFEISPFLEQLGIMTADGLDDLRKSMAKSSEDEQTYRGALSGVLRNMAMVSVEQHQLVKSMATHLGLLQERVERVENTPHPRRALSSAKAAQAAAAVLRKGGMSEDGAGPYDGLTREQVLDGMGAMFEKSMAGGAEGMAPCGEPLDRAISKMEVTGQITRPLLDDVKKHINQ